MDDLTVCRGCMRELPDSSFHKHQSRCKECCAKRDKGRKRYGQRKKSTEASRAIRRQRAKERRNDRQRMLERKNNRLYASRYPHKARAKTLVKQAIDSGVLVRPDNCPVCGKPDARGVDGRRLIQAHHHDYSKPLEVEWMCTLCHANEHRKAA